MRSGRRAGPFIGAYENKYFVVRYRCHPDIEFRGGTARHPFRKWRRECEFTTTGRGQGILVRNLWHGAGRTLGQWSLRPAKPGDVMILWGTGLGVDAASDANGGSPGDQTEAAQVRVIVGGNPVTPLYAGRSNGWPGLDQINFTIPSDVTPSCFVSLQVKAGGSCPISDQSPWRRLVRRRAPARP